MRRWRHPGRHWPVLAAIAALSFTAGGAMDAQEAAATPIADLRLDVNLPAYRLDVWERDQLLRSFRVAIGAPDYPTPTGMFTINEIVWNPVWIPPPSPWAEGKSIMAPGPSNPMRKVKLQVDGLYYIHGTPLAESIGRAESHGCIRLTPADAVALALVLQERTGAPISQATTDSLIRLSRPTRVVPLPAAVPVRVRYDLLELRGDTVVVLPDVYDRQDAQPVEAALRALQARGVDTTLVRRDVLHSLVAGNARRTTRVSLSRLMTSRVVDTARARGWDEPWSHEQNVPSLSGGCHVRD